MSRGCSRLVLPGMQPSSASAASSSSFSRGGHGGGGDRRPLPDGPFAGLVICVTGLSKGALLFCFLIFFLAQNGEISAVVLMRCASFFFLCVLGGWGFVLCAEARTQVKEATERMGGEYSGSLHPKCTHLVVQISLQRSWIMVACYLFSWVSCCFCLSNSGRHMLFLSAQHSFAGRKFEHAVKHGAKNGLFVVTLGWLVDCVRRSSKTSAILFCFQ